MLFIVWVTALNVSEDIKYGVSGLLDDGLVFGSSIHPLNYLMVQYVCGFTILQESLIPIRHRNGALVPRHAFIVIKTGESFATRWAQKAASSLSHSARTLSRPMGTLRSLCSISRGRENARGVCAFNFSRIKKPLGWVQHQFPLSVTKLMVQL